ncbi:MAG: YncE family protein [Gemmatimonadaceae bacterium]
MFRETLGGNMGAALAAMLLLLAATSRPIPLAAQKVTKAAVPTATSQPVAAPAPPTSTYWVYVGAESADLIHRIRFGPSGAAVEKTIEAGVQPTENEGPHGLQISKDGKYLHMSTGHGQPDGMYWKFELGPDTLVGDPIPLGMFPASLDVTADGLYAFVVNFNLHGEMVPSSVSVVYTPTNTEVARTTTCVMPHGSRIRADGAKQYSTCMMNDQLVELDTRTFKVTGRFSVAAGKEGAITDYHADHDMADMKVDNMEGHGAALTASCSPTWAQPGATGTLIYVACNKMNEILEIDASTWKLTRRFKTGVGPYNLAVTPDGKFLVSTLKKGSGFQMFDLTTGQSVYEDRTSTTLAHGVVVTPDSRYAFVSAEGVGAAPGKVDIFDLRAHQKVASVNVGQQASGIAFWKMEPK